MCILFVTRGLSVVGYCSTQSALTKKSRFDQCPCRGDAIFSELLQDSHEESSISRPKQNFDEVCSRDPTKICMHRMRAIVVLKQVPRVLL